MHCSSKSEKNENISTKTINLQWKPNLISQHKCKTQDLKQGIKHVQSNNAELLDKTQFKGYANDIKQEWFVLTTFCKL